MLNKLIYYSFIEYVLIMLVDIIVNFCCKCLQSSPDLFLLFPRVSMLVLKTVDHMVLRGNQCPTHPSKYRKQRLQLRSFSCTRLIFVINRL